ncbi:response regulator [Cohnella mopanensis]|uniref:response regulator n=1 Tax=Cohnella mopanensis TaxID=2911966 RepID=UPI001EF8B00F|nr:response regulator [Cohnella mopanensis]
MIIADDEYNVREGLKDLVKWGELGIEVIGLAADGQEAYNLCRELKPDILLTDIRMPLMDGLEAGLKLKELDHPIRIIIISGAQDFNYAKIALNINADGYILKPIKIPELVETARKIVASIERERNREENNDRLKRQLQENMPLLREKFWANLTQGMYGSEKEVRDKLQFFGMPFELNGNWSVAVLQIDDYEQAIERYSEENRQLLSFSILNIAEEIAGREAVFSFSMNENETVIVFRHGDRGSDLLASICQEIGDNVDKYLKMTVSAGIGSRVNAYVDLQDSYREAQAAIKFKFYTGKNSILHFADVRPGSRGIEFPKLHEAESKLVSDMKLGRSGDAAAVLEEIFDKLCSTRDLPIDYVQSVCVELIHMASRTFYEIGEDMNRIAPQHSTVIQVIYDKREAVELKSVLLAFFGDLTDHFSHKYTQKNSKLIQKIKEIISNSYMKNITVSRIAEDVFLSPNYISLIFKKETGEGITEYITKVRIDAAKELLKSEDLKVLEVAEMVGFENATYFSTVFKKVTGIHPQKYRELLKE